MSNIQTSQRNPSINRGNFEQKHRTPCPFLSDISWYDWGLLESVVFPHPTKRSLFCCQNQRMMWIKKLLMSRTTVSLMQTKWEKSWKWKKTMQIHKLSKEIYPQIEYLNVSNHQHISKTYQTNPVVCSILTGQDCDILVWDCSFNVTPLVQNTPKLSLDSVESRYFTMLKHQDFVSALTRPPSTPVWYP